MLIGVSLGGWDGVQRAVTSRALLANLTGSVVAFGTATLVDMTHDDVGASPSDVIALVAYLAIVAPIGAVLAAGSVSGAAAWMRGEQPVGTDEAQSWLRVPMKVARLSLLFWLGAALLFGVISQTADDVSALNGARIVATVVLGGLTAAAIVFLLLERCLRPVFAHIFAMHPPDGREGVTLHRRLLLAWALGGAIPLLIIGLSLVGTDPDKHPNLRLAVWALTAVGLLAGAVVTTVMARSISDPLDEIRGALSLVDHGNLDAVIPIYDASEIGLLQNGYNQMVAGLRDRRALEDLFGRHVGTDVARLARRQGVRLGGEHRDASMIFIDLVGSTRLAQSRTAVEVMGLLNAFFATVVDCIEREGGWINKFEGDAALCVFGVPAIQEDHATRALRAARQLRGELEALRATYAELQAGIGLSSGEVAAGNVGDARRYEYTVIGDPVNEAARLADQAKQRHGGLLASQQAVDKSTSDERANWNAVGEFELRGRSRTTVAFEPRDSRWVTLAGG